MARRRAGQRSEIDLRECTQMLNSQECRRRKEEELPRSANDMTKEGNTEET